MPDRMEEITADRLGYIYRDSGKQFQALEDVSFSVRHGEFVCIVGHSGCGKTTLLRILAGLMPSTSGEARIRGNAIEGPGRDRTMVFQQYSLFPWMTAKKNVLFGIRQMDKEVKKTEAERRAEDYLSKVGMAEAADQYPFQLSGGMQQRIALARSLAANADILLLDEPFGAVDTKTRAELQNLLLELWNNSRKKKTILFVTHGIDEALFLADRIFFMERGRMTHCLEIPFGHARDSEQLKKTPAYERLKAELIGLFYAGRAEDAYEEGD